MTITFTPNTNIKEVEVEGYGKVRVRPYGAGEELQIAKNLRELNELQTQAEVFLKNIKEKYGEDDAKIPEEEKKNFEKLQASVARLSDDLNEIIKGTITSEEAGVAEKLFAELPMVEIRRLISTALGKDEDAETQRTTE